MKDDGDRWSGGRCGLRRRAAVLDDWSQALRGAFLDEGKITELGGEGRRRVERQVWDRAVDLESGSVLDL